MNGKWVWIYVGLGLLLAATSQAGTRGGLYDMNAMINERHPFTIPGRASLPTAVLALPEMTPIAPPSPTLRYTPPPRPVAEAGANPMRGPYRPFGNSIDNNWFHTFYISAGMGVNLPNDLDGTTAAGATYTIEFDPGFVAQGAIGAYLGENFRIESEVTYRMADYDQATSDGDNSTPNGDLKLATGIVNLYYELDLGSFNPFLGVGAGVAQIDRTAVNSPGLTLVERDATEFAYQAIVGITYEISRDFGVSLDGRYLGTSDEDISATIATLHVRYNL